MPAIYFRLGNVQPFADMSADRAEEGVTIVRGDGKIVGLRLDDPEMVVDLPGILERLGIDARAGLVAAARRRRRDARRARRHLGRRRGLSAGRRAYRRTGSLARSEVSQRVPERRRGCRPCAGRRSRG